MNDVALYEALAASQRGEPLPPASDVVAALRAIASRPLSERTLFLGAMEPLLAHAEPAVRRAALAVLGGARGRPALEQLVRALDDPDASVREAAIDALSIACVQWPARWAMAVFHPSSAVRRAVLRRPAPMGCGDLGFHLLADPACRELAPPLPAGPAALPLVLRFVARGLLRRDEACSWLASLAPSGLVAQLHGPTLRKRSEASVARALARDARLGDDVLDDVLALLIEEAIARAGDPQAEDLDDDEPAEPEHALGDAPAPDPRDATQRVALGLFHATLKLPPMRLRIAASITAHGVRLGGLPAVLCRVLGALHPAAIADARWHRDLRRAALEGALRPGEAKPLGPGVVEALLASDVVKDDAGELDARAVAALLRIGGTLEMATRVLGEEALVDAIAREPRRAAPIFGGADPLRNALLTKVCARAGGHAALLGHAFAGAKGELAGLVDALDGDAIVLGVLGLAQLLAKEVVTLSKARRNAAREVLSRRVVEASALPALLSAWASHDDAESLLFAASVATDVARRGKGEAWLAAWDGLDDATLAKLVALLPLFVELPWPRERILAEHLAGSACAPARAWALARTVSSPAPPPRPTGVRTLTAAEEHAIAMAPDAHALAAALEPALSTPSIGVVRALARRPSIASAEAIVAALAAHEDPTSLAAQCARYGLEPDAPAALVEAVDELATLRLVPRHALLPPQAHAWLHRFERHAFEHVAACEAAPGGVTAALSAALALPCVPLMQRAWEGVARVLEIWSARDRASLARALTQPLLDLALREIDGPVGEGAARVLAVCARAALLSTWLEAQRPALAALAPALPQRVRRHLEGIIDTRGLAAASRTRVSQVEIDAGLAEARAATSLDALAQLVCDEREPVVHEAVVKLLAHGPEGERRFLELLESEGLTLPHIAAIRVAIELLESVASRARIDRLIWHGVGVARRNELRFALAAARARAMLGTEMADRFADAALDAACLEGPAWLGQGDLTFLRAHVSLERLAHTLVLSPHPVGYQWALGVLFAAEPGIRREGPERASLRAFLRGPARDLDHRLRAARWLAGEGDMTGLPVLVAEAFREVMRGGKEIGVTLPDAALPEIARGAVAGGPELEPRLMKLLHRPELPDAEGVQEALAHVLAEGGNPQARTRARGLVQVSPRRRKAKLRAIGEVFAWGVVRGRELTGRLFRFHMTDDETFGYTYIDRPDVYVTPLPILRGDRNGRAIVEGLVLHELGHQVYHRGPESKAVRDEASEAGLFRLLNLVMDEHLERNLRAIDDAWGDSLKLLAAYAFRHSVRSIELGVLLSSLGDRAAETLSGMRLGVAIRPTDVRVESGALIAALEANGHSFGRFVAALRMGLGDRWDDPRVREGLALFTRSFRKRDMVGLWEIAKELHRIFGDEVELALGVGGHEGLGEAGELLGEGDGISDKDVQGEVERVLGAPEQKAGKEGGPGRPTINVAPDERWSPLTEFVRVPPDPAAHAAVAREVDRHARTMRRALEELGLRLEPVGMRVQGRRFDRTRTLPLVTRRDPRILVARETRFRSDLFLGLCIDCSGSMTGTSMARAHAFGVMLVQAVRGLRSIDLRAFGFTDRILYDAGDASRPAVASLKASGGNNDAAALDHVVGEALRSHRRAKLVVMISDGLPTECSVAALRAVVRGATRANVACAQVAVRPLAERCFPHYVEIDGSSEHAAVSRFARVVTELVRRTLGA